MKKDSEANVEKWVDENSKRSELKDGGYSNEGDWKLKARKMLRGGHWTRMD